MKTAILILALTCCALAAPALRAAQSAPAAKPPTVSELSERLDGLHRDRLNDKGEMDLFRDTYNTDMDLLSGVLLVLLLVFGALFLLAFRDLKALKARGDAVDSALSRLESAEKALEETRLGWQAGLAGLAKRVDDLDLALKALKPAEAATETAKPALVVTPSIATSPSKALPGLLAPAKAKARKRPAPAKALGQGAAAKKKAPRKG